jgi:DNA-binding transcriptional LysR family regulator
MDVRHLRYFVAVAEELHFGHAALRLHMTQPPLSKRIADLERELGVQLFDRSPRGVALTAHGTRLLPHARKAVAAFDAAAAAMRRPARSAARRLLLAFPADTSRAVLTDVCRGLRDAGQDVEVLEATTGEQQALLADGRIDLGVLRHPYPGAGLWSSRPLRRAIGVIMPANHPLATRAALRLASLRGRTLVMFPREMAPGLYDETLAICRQHGYPPPHIVHAVRLVDGLLVTDNAISFNTEAAANRWPGLVWRPLADQPLAWRTSAVCRRADRDNTIRAAVPLLLRALRTHDAWQPIPPRRLPAS